MAGSSRRRSVRSVKSLSVADIEQDGRKQPRLGKRPDGEAWHTKVKVWWYEVWRSPVAANFDVSDHLSVWMLADIKHRLLIATANTDIIRLSGEVRHLETCLGLNPKARQAMKVEVDKGEQAETRTRRRRNKAVVQTADADTRMSDPRDALSA